MSSPADTTSMARHPLHILIVEDDYFIAQDLRRSFQRAGVSVVGPVRTTGEAADLIEGAGQIDAAVLDINLEGDGPVFPIADALEKRHVPFVFATGYDDDVIPERFGGVKRFEKPCDPDRILRFLLDGRLAAS